MTLSSRLPTEQSEGPGDRPPPKTPRLAGVDAARGIAVIGMIAVHVFNLYDEQTGSVSWLAAVFSGRSAALFAVMAGVGLALVSGGRHGHRGRNVSADRRGIAARAGVIAVVGLTLGLLEVDIAIILVCYALLFILALPFITMSIRQLAVFTAAWTLLSPAIAYLVRPLLDEAPFNAFIDTEPNWTNLADPAALLSSLFFTGSYPVFQWLNYVLLGLLLGRLALDSLRVQLWLAAAGATVLVAAQLTSSLLLQGLGGANALLATGETDSGNLVDWNKRLLLDLSDVDQTTSLWWLAVDAPHTGTTLDLLNTMGSAAMVLGLCLLLARVAGRGLLVLSGPGAMTLTLYSAHVLLMSFINGNDTTATESLLFWGQVLLFSAVGLAYGLTARRGPLERLASAVSKAARGPISLHSTFTGSP
ncbi:heparan-alpha-glucosaminide N-acetyltransferase domain-containing protein [Arthrobacter crystallopoietes]|uniref:heparan-alpha-glucosaminide N-acetyltransferase domain-containing protein n=1 Tax=Crystallibacter crystallopoietes TaxID=37928 RepID=UPI001ABE827A|nr:heparan-alpha-glucosaminide N-acetyltransferase domain-containing protein [Arthrobacter crystallopoietes]QTG82676.1 DUF1624 domain-containing protein [Arthrobacter crystallopoietes]